MIGLEIREVITKLVAVIGEAGYFIEEVEGKHRQIVVKSKSALRFRMLIFWTKLFPKFVSI